MAKEFREEAFNPVTCPESFAETFPESRPVRHHSNQASTFSGCTLALWPSNTNIWTQTNTECLLKGSALIFNTCVAPLISSAACT